jgi:N-acetylmuramoyl-L-alanine amidase
VIATRTNDSDISLADRVALSNSVKPDIFVSIHINANRSSAIAGIETYYYSAQSKELASVVYDSLTTDLKEPGNWVSYDELYVLHHNDRISILAEVGYLSHAATRKKLVRADYQERIAQALCDGIKTYFDEQAKHQGGVGQLPQGPRQAN